MQDRGLLGRNMKKPPSKCCSRNRRQDMRSDSEDSSNSGAANLLFPSLPRTNAGEQRQRTPHHTVGILEPNPAQKSILDEENTRSDELQLLLSGEKSVGI
jgi:hypothetical protein